MAIKIGFDTHVLDLFILPADQPRILPILQCVDRGAIEFYATQELIGEASRVVENKPHLLTPFGAVIGHLTAGRHLVTPEAAVISELIGQADPYAPERDRTNLYGYLHRLASGKPDMGEVRRVAAEQRRIKEESLAPWRKMCEDVKLLMERADAEGASEEDVRAAAEFRATTLPEADRRQWEANGRSETVRLAVMGDIPDPEAIADAVMENPAAFPLTRRFVRVKALLIWWWWVGPDGKGHKVHGGDVGDARQLTLLPALDHFITNDRAFKRWSETLGDPAGTVLTFDEFLGRTWC